MMKVIVYLFFGLVFITLEVSLASILPIDFFKPDLGIPFLIYTVFFLGPEAGLITAVFLGVLQEVLSSSPEGSLLFTKVAVFVISIFMKNKIYIDSKYSFSFVCAGAVLLESFLFLALTFLARGESKDAFNVAFYSIPNALFTGFLSLPIFSFIGFLNARYLNRQHS